MWLPTGSWNPCLHLPTGIIYSTYVRYLVLSEHLAHVFHQGEQGHHPCTKDTWCKTMGGTKRGRQSPQAQGQERAKRLKPKLEWRRGRRHKMAKPKLDLFRCWAWKAVEAPDAGSLVFSAAVSWLLMWVSSGTTQLISKEESRVTTGNHSEILGCRVPKPFILFVFLTLRKRSVSYRVWFGPGRSGYGDFIMNFRLWFYQRTNDSPEKQHSITVKAFTLLSRKFKPKKGERANPEASKCMFSKQLRSPC